ADRPGERDPAAITQLADEVLAGAGDAIFALCLPHHLLGQLGGEEVPDLPAEGPLLLGDGEVHSAPLPPAGFYASVKFARSLPVCDRGGQASNEWWRGVLRRPGSSRAGNGRGAGGRAGRGCGGPLLRATARRPGGR